MSDIDVARLATLERVVEQGSKTVLEVAAALAEIRENRLYKASHSSFAEYVEERFGFGRRWAQMLIKRTQPAALPPAAGSVAEQEGPVVDGWDVPEEQDDVPDSRPPRLAIDVASDAFGDVLATIRLLANRVGALIESHGKFLAGDSIESLLTNLRSEIVWGQPSKPCPHEPFDQEHAATCQCRGSMWLPRSQTQEGKARARRASRHAI
jgi:hypothetical protein